MSAQIFDLTPHPRILPMLGQIPLAQWKCLAELMDNCIDSFIEATRKKEPIVNPRIIINTPLTSTDAGQISVRDNGTGMDSKSLEKAAKAGWSGRNPIDNLGLFGMGFNIATARLASKTTVWTTRRGDAEWVGLEIDFDTLTKKGSFITTELRRPKPDPSESGTEVLLERLKPEMREWFAKAPHRTQISKNLGRTYSAMLASAGKPINFALEINGKPVKPRPHCVWGGPGNPDRLSEHPILGPINAFQDFDFSLPARKFCVDCWNWLGVGETECSQCLGDGTVVERERRIRGWLGIQRFQHETDFGIDLLRNGRKIEIACKDLFSWKDPETDEETNEYPIDDQRHRGRIVGEIHLDHCQVPYTKERFLREDAAWSEMVALVRGPGPLQPRIAEARGLGANSSPLYKLYQAYRRSSPQGKSGSWAKLLVVKDNDRSQEMYRKFENGEIDYQSDTKWYELAVEEDNRSLQTGGSSGGGATLGGGTSTGGEDGSTTAQPPGTPPNPAPAPDTPPLPPTPIARQPIHDLTREYRDDLTGQLFNIRAHFAQSNDPDLQGQPWNLQKQANGTWLYLVNEASPVFQSATLTPLDSLLVSCAYYAGDLERSQGLPYRVPAILSSFREKFAERFKLDPIDLSKKAMASIRQLAASAAERASKDTLMNFFEIECSPSVQETIRATMARRAAAKPQQAVQDGRYLNYCPPQIVMDFIVSHPEEFFDGKYWDESYVDLDFGSPSADGEARRRILNYYTSLLADVVWLSQIEGTEPAATREKLLRASLAADLLSPTVELP